jgi:hypothetical protein
MWREDRLIPGGMNRVEALLIGGDEENVWSVWHE